MLDPFQRMNRANASLKIKPSKSGQINSVEELVESYGIEFSKKSVVGDFKNAATVSSATGRNFSYPYWLQIREENISKSHAISASINELLFAETGYFQNNNRLITLESIATTSSETSDTKSAVFNQMTTEDLSIDFQAVTTKPKTIVARISGLLHSAFDIQFSNKGKRQNPLFLVGDVDWIYDGFSRADVQAGGQTSSQPINDNHSLFLNMVEAAVGDPRLTEIRSRKGSIRPFTKIEDMLFQSRKLYEATEAKYLSTIKKAEANIIEVLKLANVSTFEELPEDIKTDVTQLRSLIYPLKEELREIRLKMRRGINDLFQALILANLFSGPALAFLFFIFARRTRTVSP